MQGHKVGGWLCAECGVVNSAEESGVVPALVLLDNIPSITLTAKDGHVEVITLGWRNLHIFLAQGLHLAEHFNQDS